MLVYEQYFSFVFKVDMIIVLLCSYMNDGLVDFALFLILRH